MRRDGKVLDSGDYVALLRRRPGMTESIVGRVHHIRLQSTAGRARDLCTAPPGGSSTTG